MQTRERSSATAGSTPPETVNVPHSLVGERGGLAFPDGGKLLDMTANIQRDWCPCWPAGSAIIEPGSRRQDPNVANFSAPVATSSSPSSYARPSPTRVSLIRIPIDRRACAVDVLAPW